MFLEAGESDRGHIFESLENHAKDLCSNRKVMGAMERSGVVQNIHPSCRAEVGLEKMVQPRNMVGS